MENSQASLRRAEDSAALPCVGGTCQEPEKLYTGGVSLADILENVRRFAPFVLSLLLALVALIGWRRHKEIGFLVLGLWALVIVVNESLIRFGLAPARQFLNQKIGQPETDQLVAVVLFVESLLYHCGLLAAVALLVFRRKHLRREPAK